LSSLFLWNGSNFLYAFVERFTLCLLTLKLVFRQFFKKFRLGKIGQELGRNLRYDRRETHQILVDRTAALLASDVELEEIFGIVRITASRAQDDRAQRLAEPRAFIAAKRIRFFIAAARPIT